MIRLVCTVALLSEGLLCNVLIMKVYSLGDWCVLYLCQSLTSCETNVCYMDVKVILPGGLVCTVTLLPGSLVYTISKLPERLVCTVALLPGRRVCIVWLSDTYCLED